MASVTMICHHNVGWHLPSHAFLELKHLLSETFRELFPRPSNHISYARFHTMVPVPQVHRGDHIVREVGARMAVLEAARSSIRVETAAILHGRYGSSRWAIAVIAPEQRIQSALYLSTALLPSTTLTSSCTPTHPVTLDVCIHTRSHAPVPLEVHVHH